MIDDWEYCDVACPKCGESSTRACRCSVIGCDDGQIDLHEFDDPINFSPGETETCDECSGTGWVRWCGKCGYELTLSDLAAVELEIVDPFGAEFGSDDDLFCHRHQTQLVLFETDKESRYYCPECQREDDEAMGRR